ncbi:hypothetical protein FPOAC1_007330 [Fusarium poae]|uniref:Uncharacterized protein n=1 Tax=Fusarium poae TaxID=36050 RepID=A0A1B8AAV1_FUSPO|nr:hypothetical protein FPOAC1_007330 [Fusarium poae]KAG8674011.1 hypothetical protein FPOAC1_007330 [Fusarium poae]OBS17585.1 hypothetical protein FPOA_11988 [Fusarium poae]
MKQHAWLSSTARGVGHTYPGAGRHGQSFIHRNGLAGKEVEMPEDLIASSRKTDLLDQTGEWKWAGIRKYLKLVKRFEEFLLLLAHITGGQPSRGEEITGLRLINGINRDRNIFIIDGKVVLVTQYHKSLAHFDSPKVIPRFLPGRIGQLFVMYMIYIRPLTDRWEVDKWELYGGKMAPPSDFIWHNEAAGGVPWESWIRSGITAGLQVDEVRQYEYMVEEGSTSVLEEDVGP